MAIEYNFTLDMDRSKRDNNIAYARTGDMDSITINADLVFGGAAYTPSGTNAFFECITPNGRSVRASAEKSGSSVSVEVPSAAFQAAGVINVAYFRFESGASGNPTYVESTEPFAIVVREGIGDNIDAGDYIEEWRKLADQLEAAVAEVEKKAEQAETAINEQKTEVDQLKAQAQKAIAGDVTEVEGVAQSAIAAINKEKADVADAAEGVSAAGEQAINSFNSKGTSAINKFNIDGTSAINQFNTNAGSKLDEVDDMITEAHGDVDAAITQLETATGKAVSAMEDALDGTTAGSLQNAINRTLKLDVADMTNIPDNSSLSSFTNVGSYCCKTAATAATVGDCPIDDSPFNMYVFSSSTSGQVMQLVVPIDLNGKPTAEWHVRFGTSSAMDPWSVIGGGADIAAGLGIDVTGDAQKTVALDTTAFYQHHEAADIIQGSTEVTGGGQIKKLTVYGNTRQNMWVNQSGTGNGITVTSNDDGSMTFSGTATKDSLLHKKTYAFETGKTYTFSVDKKLSDSISTAFYYEFYNTEGKWLRTEFFGYGSTLSSTVQAPSNLGWIGLSVKISKGATVSGTYHVMLNEGSEAQLWCPPGLNGVDELSIVTAGKNLLPIETIGRSEDGQTDSTFTSQGITWKLNPDGTINANGTATANTYCYIKFNNLVLHPGTYTRNGSIHGFVTEDGNIRDATFILDRPRKINSAYINVNNGSNVNTTIYPQLELGSTATAYEPPAVTVTPVDLNGHALHSLPDGTRDELRIDSTGVASIEQSCIEFTFPSDESAYVDDLTKNNRIAATFDIPAGFNYEYSRNYMYCDSFPVRYGTFDKTKTEVYISASGSQIYFQTPGKTKSEMVSMVAGAKVIYVAYAQQTVKLEGTVVMPDLASPSYVIYANSDVPAEIEAEAVKVDYLPPSDVYTKEEVDRKIDDAGMPVVVPVSKGGTGVTTAAAERNRLGLGNTTGALPVANGGTGKTTVKAAQNALLANINTVSTDVGDDSFFVGYYQKPSDATGALYKRVGSDIWNWIVSKIRSTFGFSSSNVLPVANGGTGSTSVKAAQNSLLNDMNESSDVLTDSSMLVGYNASPSASDGAVHKRSVSTVWDYIASKVADKVWDQIKTKAVRSDTATGADLTLIGGLESMSHVLTSTLTLGINEMSLDNSNAVPFTVNGEEVITEGNISSHLPATFDAKSVWFSTPLKQGQQKNIITEGAFTLDELRKYFVPGNLVLANFICGGEHDVQLDQVVPMVITIGEGITMQPSGTTYNSITNAHYNCIFAVANNEQAGGGGGSGFADGVTMLYSVTEVPGFVDRTSTSSLKGFTVFDLVSHAI